MKQNGLAIEILIEYVIVEEYGENIMHFLETEFGTFSILEHFQSFYRFKLNSSVSIGKLFGDFEDHVEIFIFFFLFRFLQKEQLKISQYSIKQATIEQIFNMFANEQVFLSFF